jgi:hypothetical protein
MADKVHAIQAAQAAGAVSWRRCRWLAALREDEGNKAGRQRDQVGLVRLEVQCVPAHTQILGRL